MTIIQTRRVRLRELEAADDEHVRELFGDPQVMRHFPELRSDEAARGWQSAVRRLYAACGYGPWTVELHDGTFMGQCGPLPQQIDGRCEIEIVVFFLRPFWRAGYAQEAGLACVRYAFERIGVSRIVTLIHQANRPPIRLAQRCGLTFERYIEKDGATAVLYTLGATEARGVLAGRDDDVEIIARPNRRPGIEAQPSESEHRSGVLHPG